LDEFKNGAFAGYLSKTENTQLISQWVSRNSSNKLQALQNTAHIAFHFIKYQSDKETYGVDEKFAQPDEVLAKGAGDCDCDSGLISSIIDGLPSNLKPDECRVVIGRYLGSFPPNPFEYHAWTEARIGNSWYILDGTSGEVMEKPNIFYLPLFNMYPDKVLLNNPGVEMALVAPIIPVLSVAGLIKKIIREQGGN
jgi:hypothetical protein